VTIEAYLDSIKERFVTNPIVTSFQMIRERSTLVDGHLRVRLTLADGSQLEFSEYMQRSPAGEIAVITYSYHWPMPTTSLSSVRVTRRIFLISLDFLTTFMTERQVR
jgi:hypothetical protein